MAKKLKKNFIYAVGRRKSASARVRLFKGAGDVVINGELIGKYFPGETAKIAWQKPLELAGLAGKYYFTVKVVGGGKNGQLEATVMGLSRAIAQISESHRKSVKKVGLLTRDPRERERRKVGTGGRARRKKQSPKR